MSEKQDLTDKTSFSNVVSAVVILLGIAYAIWQKDAKLVTFITGAGIGYLFGSKKNEH